MMQRLTYYKINEGAIVPRFYGVAWHNYSMCYIVVCPIPLNIVVGLVRMTWIYLASRLRPDILTQAWLDGAAHERRVRDAQAKHLREIEWEQLAHSIRSANSVNTKSKEGQNV